MQRLLNLLLLLLIPFSLQAELYKGTDEEGNVYFTDKEIPNSEIIPMHMPTVVKMPKPEDAKKPAEETKQTASYSTLKISQPANDATVRNNNGNVTVTLEIEPALNTNAGHNISILVDGKPVITKSTSLLNQLTNIDRGSHSITAHVKNNKNKTIKISNSITIHLKRKGLSAAPRVIIDPENEVMVFNGPGPQVLSFQPGPIINQPAP